MLTTPIAVMSRCPRVSAPVHHWSKISQATGGHQEQRFQATTLPTMPTHV